MMHPSFWTNLFRKDSKEKDVIEALRNTYIFETLNKRELQLVSQTIHVREYAPGESIFSQGELGVGMYIVLKGKVQIFVRTQTAEEEESSFVASLGDGDFFGEISLIENNSRRTASALASVETSLIGFFKPDLMEILDRQPSTGGKIVLRVAEVLGRRLKETTSRISELKDELKVHNSRGLA